MRYLVPALVVLALQAEVRALEPGEIIIVVNRMVPSSGELAEHYCKIRGVPKENVVALMLPRAEEMSREEYVKWLVAPLREALGEKKDKVKCLLLMYGVPIRVLGPVPNAGEKAEAARLKPLLEAAKQKAGSADAKEAAAGRSEAARLEADLMNIEHRESIASVDSELMLLWWDNYPLTRWVLNPLHWQAGEKHRRGKPPVLLTARLDGPSPELVRRLIDDAVAVEAEGLKGKVYIDAREIAFDPKNPRENGGYGYGGYDESMRELAAMFQAAKWEVTLDNKPALFPPKSCADAAIYCGWYSHGKYVDCCTFTRGAVAWHLASSEAYTLRHDDSPVWCPNLLKAGVAVTLGPVTEPYTVGFPKPAEFFGFLGAGEWPLAEVYGRTVHFASWTMLCVGDPLYTPFRKRPVWKLSDVVASPKGGQSLYR